jgi:hypothetical protein
MDISLQIGFIGTLASLAGLFVAGLQTIRLSELRRRTNADLWHSIGMVRSMMVELESCSAFKQGDGDVKQSYGTLIELFRLLLKGAVLDERRFTEETINRWRRSGRLATDWQEKQARRFLRTPQIGSPRPFKQRKNEDDPK